MNTIRCTLGALLAAIVLSGPAAAQSGDAQSSAEPERGRVIGAKISEHPEWFKESFLDIAEDVSEAAGEGKHVLLFFHIEACPYCYKMVEENFKHSPYTDFLREHFDIIAIDIKGDREVAFNEALTLTEKELARHVKVRFTPTVLFLDHDNNVVLRLNGYRSVAAFEHVLHFVHEQAYRHTTLSEYIAERQQNVVYRLREHPNFAAIDDLASVADRPLLVLFEDSTCDECDTLHDTMLNLAETREILGNFTVVRLDAHSQEPLTALDGTRTTPKDFALALGITYRPGIVMFDRGREIMRIDGMQRTFHFQLALRYVGERHYERYPRFRDYVNAREEELLSSGQDVDVWK